jgi:three-Cys-motif partner protein
VYPAGNGPALSGPAPRRLVRIEGGVAALGLPGAGRMAKKKRKKFFSRQTEASRRKAEIIAKYFPAWATVIRSRATKMAYIDLYAGRGVYDDGAESTPLLVLRHAIADPIVRKMLVTIFNDKKHADELRANIEALPDIDKLKFKPAVYRMEVAEDTTKLFESMKLVPTLALLDPWGYKGLTRDLIHSLLKDWGCDLIFFFNYNRINMGIRNKKVGKHMEALFGPAWLAELQQEVPGLRPARRERVVLRALRNGLRELGGEYIRHFRFLKKNGRTSHHLIFVTKDFKGVEIMREVMARPGISSRHVDDVASFTYDPRVVNDAQPELPDTSPIDKLAERLLAHFAGKTRKVRDIFETHSGDGRYIERNYKEALRRLEADGRVTADPPASARQWRKGKATMAGHVAITFPTV